MKVPLAMLAIAGAGLGAGHPLAKDDPYQGEVHGASNEAEQAIGHIRVADGIKVELWAAEPMVANPVCLRVDDHDRVYLVETFRHTSNVLDIRGHMDWLTEDLACRTVADRIALLKRKYGPNVRKFTNDDDRIRLIEDTKGTGKADKATVFASGFNKIESGIAAGVLPFHGSVYFADIPSLYLLRDNRNEGAADFREELSTGYGVHISFLGHDLHGLAIGPDKKLYFSIGDRGASAKAVDGSAVNLPDTGGVFRCNLDGTQLEPFASGLRNPQQLCFDDYGDLFTGDNNPDYGDPARWVYVVQGGDSGWRIGYQEAQFPRGGGPWMWEQLYQTKDKLKDAAYILPPVAHLGAGPSGVQHYPGTGLPARYDDHFFMVDFRGGSAQSVVHSFAMKPNGATFDLVDHDNFIRGLLVTDIDFSTRGGLYACDWTEGWDKPGKGRIYHFFDPKAASDPVVAQTQKLLFDGFATRPTEELVKLLGHRDHRVRQEAQFALADKGAEAIAPLKAVAGNAGAPSDLLPRLHAIWALGQLGPGNPSAFDALVPLLGDANAEVRAQAGKVLGEGHVSAAYDGLIKLLKDTEARPKFFAAIALGNLHRPEAAAPLMEMLRQNEDKDAHLRHAGVMGLLGSNNPVEIMRGLHDPSPSARLGALLVMRRQALPAISSFLIDPDPRLVSEAAHAINDVPIPQAYPALYAMLKSPHLPETVLVRAVNAGYRVGTADAAKALADFAARPDGPDWIRVRALQDLGEWANPSPLDHVMHMYWPLPGRPDAAAREAAGMVITKILHTAPGAPTPPEKVRVAAVALIKQLKIKDSAVLLTIIGGKDYPPALRAEALEALADNNDPKLAGSVNLALADPSPVVRIAAIGALPRLPSATARLQDVIAKGTPPEQQAALAALGEVTDASAEKQLGADLDDLLAGRWKPELALDLLDAARKRNSPALAAQLQKYDAAQNKSDPLAEFRVALTGGNADNGYAIMQRSDASCIRCHTVHHQGGIVGPVLDGVGSRQNREYLLESIVYPNAKIAPGFETALIHLKNGKTVTGVVKKETPAQVDLMNADGKIEAVKTADIQSRTRGVSAMPEGFAKTLSKRDLRDLVEFLAELKN